MKELELLQQKLEQLMKRFSALLADRERLEQAGKRQAGIITEQQARIAALESELRLKAVARSASETHTEEEKEQLKLHLDRMIREIEKNIELL